MMSMVVLKMSIVLLSYCRIATAVGIYLAFLFRYLGMVIGYQHHLFINPSITMASWKEKI